MAASAGNHALGLAYHAQLLEIPATMVMPKWAPLVKVSNCRGFGATVVLHGECYEDAKTLAQHLAEERKLTYIPGFDDRDIIAGQGTMGLEILQDVPDVDAVIVPIGGGGVISGIAVAVKSLKPDVRSSALSPPTLRQCTNPFVAANSSASTLSRRWPTDWPSPRAGSFASRSFKNWSIA